MIKLALVAAANENHGKAFTQIINGEFDPKTGKPVVAPDARLADATITRIWDPSKRHARALARTRHIPTVVDDLADAADGVDGVIIADDATQKHVRYAGPFIDRGVPLFVDKPLSRDYAEAKAVIARVRRKKMLFQSGSSLRYCDEVAAVNRTKRTALGEPVLGATFSPNELIFYGIHALDLLLGVVPGPVKSVQHMGTDERDLVVLFFASGARATLMCGEGAAGGFHLVVHGTKGRVVIDRPTNFYQNMLAHFVRMIRTGQPPISLDETLHVIAVLNAAQKSVESGGRRVPVPGVRGKSFR